MKDTFKIKNVPCRQCAMTMGGDINTIQGVFGINIDIAQMTITIDHTDEINKDELLRKLEELGYL